MLKAKQDAGTTIHRARERRGLSRVAVEALTKEAGYTVDKDTLRKLELGLTSAPYPRTLYALADVLGLDGDSLFVEEVSA